MAAVPLLNGSSTSSEDDYDESEKLISLKRQRKPILCKNNIKWALAGCCLLGITIGLSVGVAIVVVRSMQSPSSLACLKQTSRPSPVTKDLEITYHTQRFDGSFLDENVYRQAAGPQVDAAWEALGVNCKSCCRLA